MMKLWESKKARVTIVTAVVDLVAIILTLFVLPIDEETKAQMVTALLTLGGVVIVGYNHGQGLADQGKEAKKLVLLLIPLALLTGCVSSPAFIAAGEKYHRFTKTLIDDYVLKGSGLLHGNLSEVEHHLKNYEADLAKAAATDDPTEKRVATESAAANLRRVRVVLKAMKKIIPLWKREETDVINDAVDRYGKAVEAEK